MDGMKTYRSNLARARGIGPAKAGAKGWMALRISALALVPLCVWFMYSAVQLSSSSISHEVVMIWLKMPVNAFLIVMFLALSAYHGFLGVKEVIEDYIHAEGLKYAAIISKQLGFLFLSAAAIFAVLSIYFKG
jgi:succinate dehydrogenase / fumarate reductase membrane anchor subunit